MNILLWEWNLDVILTKGVINGVQYITDDIGPLRCIGPNEHFQVDAGVCQLSYH